MRDAFWFAFEVVRSRKPGQTGESMFYAGLEWWAKKSGTREEKDILQAAQMLAGELLHCTDALPDQGLVAIMDAGFELKKTTYAGATRAILDEKSGLRRVTETEQIDESRGPMNPDLKVALAGEVRPEWTCWKCGRPAEYVVEDEVDNEHFQFACGEHKDTEGIASRLGEKPTEQDERNSKLLLGLFRGTGIGVGVSEDVIKRWLEWCRAARVHAAAVELVAEGKVDVRWDEATNEWAWRARPTTEPQEGDAMTGRTETAPVPVDLGVKHADDSFACELSDGWYPPPVPEHSYDALYVVNGKDLIRVLHEANNPFETIVFEIADKQPEGITKTSEFDGPAGAFKVVVKAYREPMSEGAGERG